jgi:hypothetical protein
MGIDEELDDNVYHEAWFLGEEIELVAPPAAPQTGFSRFVQSIEVKE